MEITHRIQKIVLSGLLLLTVSCTGGTVLRTDYVKPPVADAGLFSLILYGGQNIHDLETVTILDKEGDMYHVQPYSPEFNYRINKNLKLDEALEQAENFLGNLHFFHQTGTRVIKDPNGEIIGYELRPLFMSVHFSVTDPVETSYVLMEDNSVRVYVSHQGPRGPSLFKSRKR